MPGRLKPQFKLSQIMIGMGLIAVVLVFYPIFESRKHSNIYESFSHSRLANDLILENGSLHLIGGRGTENGYITLVAPLDYTESLLFCDIESAMERRFSDEAEEFILESDLIKYKNEDVGFVLSWKSRSSAGKLVVFAAELTKKTRKFAGSEMAVFGFSYIIAEEQRKQ